MLWGCFAAGGTSAHYKIDGIMRKENYMDILKQPLKTSARKLNLGHKWVFQMDNDNKHNSKVVAKWLKDNKVKVLEWLSQSPDLSLIENLWAELKKHVQARWPINLTQLHQFCMEEWANITANSVIVRSLYKAKKKRETIQRRCYEILTKYVNF